MVYDYKCSNDKCANHYNVVKITKTMSECSNLEYCELCGCRLDRTIESLVCGMSIDKTGSFYRKCN